MSEKVYQATIGLEVHVELATKSKMFCGCKNDPHESEPNTHVCPVCLAHPGSLPVPNEAAIAAVLTFGAAVGATPATYSEFDRKNYFYPDIPKAYQLSQYAFPFLTGGSLKGVTLTRVHLEEDTARSQHDKGDFSLVDFNRAGVPLMELVTEPVIHDAVTAGDFARELQLVLRTLGVAKAQMERGEMRVEANISVSDTEGVLGTKVEVKNLNSFKSVEGAIAFEIDRQVDVLKSGGSVSQETRGWDEVKLRTFTQRSKETAKDYRYFPDPDIPKMDISKHIAFSRLNDIIIELPEDKRKKYSNLGLTINTSNQIVADEFSDTYFSSVCKRALAAKLPNEVVVLAANYLTSDLLSIISKGVELTLTPEHFLELMQMIHAGDITSRVAKDILTEIAVSNEHPRTVATERGLLRSVDTSALMSLVAAVVTEFSAVADEYKGGKVTALQFLLGQAMKQSRGSADPEILKQLLIEYLK
ncbi:Asp-tRNA(Asn)/Glu-tRNA(Gln) amidotransferase subunit GatB [Patescibacteria group bacterium]|nr:Asp-tRNA(Asn)/Glu-tRNA(Gln) amidotransferase subunit GatB [Patescibacteria group bacterium]